MERRQFARIKVSLYLKFKSISTFESMIEGSASDLSQGGIFLKTSETKPVGTRIQLELPLPDGEVISMEGVVRSIRYERGEPIGMGIQFDNISKDAQAVIDEIAGRQA